MEESLYTSKLLALWPVEGAASNEILGLADEAVRAFPSSPRLWRMRGDLIQLGAGETSHTLADALASYERAISIDPNFVEGYEEIGHFYDSVMSDPERA